MVQLYAYMLDYVSSRLTYVHLSRKYIFTTNILNVLRVLQALLQLKVGSTLIHNIKNIKHREMCREIILMNHFLQDY